MPDHQDQSEECVGDWFETVCAVPGVGGGFGAPAAEKYPTPNLPLSILEDANSWSFRKENRNTAPFMPPPMLKWQLLLEMMLVFHLFVQKRDFVPLHEQLADFLAHHFAAAGISHTIEQGVWMKMLTQTCAYFNKYFTSDLLEVDDNRAHLKRLLDLMFDRRYHIATMMACAFNIANGRRTLVATSLIEGGVLPPVFAEGAWGEIAWLHGELIYDYLRRMSKYALIPSSSLLRGGNSKSRR